MNPINPKTPGVYIQYKNQQDWISIEDKLPKEGFDLHLKQSDGNVVEIDGVCYIGYHTVLGHQFVADDSEEGPVYFLNVTHWRYSPLDDEILKVINTDINDKIPGIDMDKIVKK